MKTRILIVDDEPELLSSMSDYLTSRGHDCICATEAAEAIALLAFVPFDVVITDVYLSHVPQADGFAVLSFVRQRALASRVIVMTGHDSPEVLGEAKRLAADLVLRKPVPLAELDAALVAFFQTS